MASKTEDTVSPGWTFCFFDCAAPEMDASNERAEHRKSAMRIGVEREMTIMYQQPHLVPPMKLTVYDQMPATPIPPPPTSLTKMMNQGRVLASRASQRASFSMRKRSSSRPIISNPQLVEARSPSTKRYRPLELSIYAPQNRLSDLPEFDSEAVNFTDDGAIQLPPRALVRAKSQELRRTPSARTPNKSKSMIEPALLHRRTDTGSTVVSTSRPPSNYDALHSHPVSWIEGSLPGLPPQCHHRNPTQATTVLSPMQEEFTPACTPACITIDGTMLEFPKQDPEPRSISPEYEPAPAPQIVSTTVSKKITAAPFTLSSPPPTAAVSIKSLSSPTQSQPSPALPTATAAASHQGSPSLSSVYSTATTSTRLSNWLNHQRTPSSTTSISTTKSFAEHRRKRSEFYQVRIPKVPAVAISSSPTSPPSTRIPFTQQFKHQRQHPRARTLSESTVGSESTMSTDIMSLDDDDAESVTTMSTTHVVRDVRSLSRATTAAKGEGRAEKNGVGHFEELQGDKEEDRRDVVVIPYITNEGAEWKEIEVDGAVGVAF